MSIGIRKIKRLLCFLIQLFYCIIIINTKAHNIGNYSIKFEHYSKKNYIENYIMNIVPSNFI